MKIQKFKKKLQGYISSGKVGKNFYPQKIQNLCLKSYCAVNSYDFILSATEFKMKNSSLVLKGLNENKKNFDGILFFSINQLNKDKFLILKNLIKKKKEVHFYNENLKIKNERDLKNVLFLKKIDKILNQKN